MTSTSERSVILIDNFDSFTFNIAQMVGNANGRPPIVLPNIVPWREIRKIPHSRIILSPGPGAPQIARDVGCTMDVLRHAQAPVLGVCLGHQCLALHYGGRVVRAAQPLHGRIRRVCHAEDSLFRRLPQNFDVVRYHSLTVATDLPDCLQVIAWDDDRNIMGLRHRRRPQWGVQFHPESICSEFGQEIFSNFMSDLHDAEADQAEAELTPQ